MHTMFKTTKIADLGHIIDCGTNKIIIKMFKI